MTPETKANKALLRLCNTPGYNLEAIRLEHVTGIPDWLILGDNGRMLFVEMKRFDTGGKLSAVQIKKHAELRAKGHNVMVVKDKTDLLDVLKYFK